jgi:hypothetical protein
MSDLGGYEEIKTRHTRNGSGNGFAKPNGHDRTPPELPRIDQADVARWRDREPPEIVFAIEDLVPQGMVTLLTSEGGAGKTLLMQMAGTVVASGTGSFLGKATITGRAAGVFAEDPEAVLHVRQPRINGYLNVDYDMVAGRYFPQSYFGLPAQLWGVGGSTDFFEALEQQLSGIVALRLLTLDNAALLFAGDENSRPEVTAFLSALNGMADRLDIAIILSAHASKSQDGTSLRVTSGSTAWINAARSVLEVKAGGKDDEGPSLTVVKANHALSGPATTIPLQWQDKLLVPLNSRGGIIGFIERRTCEHVFLDLLDKVKSQGRYVNDSKTTSRYAPKLFAGQSEPERYGVKEFEGAMERLFSRGAIAVRPDGLPGRQHTEITRVGAASVHP